jgi:predicted O-methyltransferase YrrM
MDELRGENGIVSKPGALASGESVSGKQRSTDPERAKLLSAIFAMPADPVEPQHTNEVRSEIGKFEKMKGFAKTYGQALKHSAFILSVGPLTDSGRRAIENVSALAESAKNSWDITPKTTPPPLIPKLAAHAFINLPSEVAVQKAEGVHGNVSLLELLIICKVVRAVNPTVSFEIGTFDGRTTLNIAANSNESAKVFTLDLPRSEQSVAVLQLDESDLRHIDKDESGSVFAASPLKTKITQLFGDSGTFDFSKYSGQVDLIFIDGAHSYEYVLSDSRNAIEMLGKQGVIFWHDYGAEWWPGVTRALNELYASDPRFCTMRHIEGTSLVVLWRDSRDFPNNSQA